MPTNHPPEFPPWIAGMLGRHSECTQCKTPLSSEDVISIGLYCPTSISVDVIGPRGGFDIRCPQCDHIMRYSLDVPLTDVVMAINSFYELILGRMDETPEPMWAMLPSPNLKKNKYETPAHNPEFGLEEGRIRRTRKDPKLQQMPSGKEVQAFLKRLDKTSFKFWSKSYKKFMDDLRVEFHPPKKGGES